jgi:hypothetical protein
MFVIISNCIAFILLLAAYIFVKSEPKTLILAWFGFTGTECLALAGIRLSENVKKPIPPTCSDDTQPTKKEESSI